jgi:3-oxoacyl-[acyl-carrier protein] reductase
VQLDLKGRASIVTGASTGIGRAIAIRLAGEGVRVAAVARGMERLEALKAHIVEAGYTPPVLISQDMLDDDAPEVIQRKSEEALGGIDILVNNVGGSRPVPLDEPEASWIEAHKLNFIQPRRLTHQLLTGMMARRWGRIVNITGKSEPERLSPTGSAKAATHAWSKALSREVGRFGITINCIAPGRIMSEQILRKYPPDYRKEFAESEIPVGFWGEPDDLAAMATFLVSPVARYITGTVIPVDGGLRRYQF